MTKPKRKTPETDLQIAIVQWFEWAYPELADDLHHSPNGGLRTKSEAARFKQMGVRKGWLDLQLPIPAGRYHGFFLEVKAPNTKPDPKKDAEQIKRIQRLRRYGNFADWVNDFEIATTLITNYLSYLNIKPRVRGC